MKTKAKIEPEIDEPDPPGIVFNLDEEELAYEAEMEYAVPASPETLAKFWAIVDGTNKNKSPKKSAAKKFNLTAAAL